MVVKRGWVKAGACQVADAETETQEAVLRAGLAAAKVVDVEREQVEKVDKKSVNSLHFSAILA